MLGVFRSIVTAILCGSLLEKRTLDLLHPLLENCRDSEIYDLPSIMFISFGVGRRMCPGINFAMATIEIALANLLYHFNWELANGLNPMDLDM
ncbi:hypothetical protein C4D60_Mb03t11670 [Musa balbisiana]|uniref:Cytochrome P450 family protein n=1 Tax=Musa balbisiana TaxID=52838 RepID=A0A4S8JBN4_MUSBA|nr:hypothetical protein C4D60_Mb03t11670 [Musa balbisiana]